MENMYLPYPYTILYQWRALWGTVKDWAVPSRTEGKEEESTQSYKHMGRPGTSRVASDSLCCQHADLTGAGEMIMCSDGEWQERTWQVWSLRIFSQWRPDTIQSQDAGLLSQAGPQTPHPLSVTLWQSSTTTARVFICVAHFHAG